MNKHSKLIRILVAMVLAALCAGSGLATLASATGAAVPAARLYLAATLAAVLCGLGSVSGTFALAALVLAAVAGVFYVPGHLAGFRAIRPLFEYWAGGDASGEQILQGSDVLLTCGAFLLGAMFFGMIQRRELSSMAVLLELTLLIGSHAMSATASIPASLPGLAACAAVFALTGGLSRDSAMARTLLPSALAVALALMLVPGGRVTWKPLEDAATRVRIVFEQYFNFTRQRIAYSINEQGYDHAGETDEGVVAMLGGPAHPHEDVVMRVESDAELLLRGTVRATYTGYSWVDTVPRSRYLYYDLTRRSIRDHVFNLDQDDDPDAFETAHARVEILSEGTSTLFAPVRLSEFDMDLANAVYYNTAGEIFMARQVAPGDRYTLTSLVPVEGEALRGAAIRGDLSDDLDYPAILAEYTALPGGIDPKVYSLAAEITKDAYSAYDRAVAIRQYLQRNMRYTLETDYPPLGQDFVSHFLLDTRQGYCSYYASAMAVLGRIVGLPTRYAEGYLVRPNGDGEVTVTGWDAHAWAEVYLRGVGWVPFDATGGATGRGPGQDHSGGSERDTSGSGNAPKDTPSPSPTATDSLNEDDIAGDVDTPSPSPSPTPDGGDAALDGGEEPSPEPTDTPEPDADISADDEQDDTPEDEPETDADPNQLPPEDDFGDSDDDSDEDDDPDRDPRWLLLLIPLLLIALIALLIAWARRRLRRADPLLLTDDESDPDRQAMILYRASLTLLGQLGQAPVNGETPEAFAGRVAKQLKNPDFAAFTRAVALRRYGRRPLEESDIAAGRKAYQRFERTMTRRERLRYGLLRVRRGLGDFDQIP